MAVALGIDVGTTAVKCALVDTQSQALLASGSTATAAYQQSENGKAEQDVQVILKAVQTALDQLPRHLVEQVTSVGICGQMHGIVWWRAADAVRDWEALLLAGETLASRAWSRLVTWEDQRCSSTYLSDCERRVSAASSLSLSSSSSCLSSGYGLATYAHTLAHDPSSLTAYDACGTIHDLLAFLLCGYSKPEEASIDTTDAFSWGGFDSETHNWNWTTVDALGIPRAVLPPVLPPGSVIGHTPPLHCSSLFGLPGGVAVYVPMGDHPCSVVAAISQRPSNELASPGLSLVSIGTSAQLAMILPRDAFTITSQTATRSFEVRPFLTSHQVLGVAAALSGGNMFAWLVRQCQQWMAELTVDGMAPEESVVYERLIKLGLEKLDTTLTFLPTLNGERGAPDIYGRIDALQLGNGSLGDLSASLGRGLIQNLVQMVPNELQDQLQTSRMIGTGNALVRNPILQHSLRETLHSPAQLCVQDAADAAFGAAMVPTVLANLQEF